MKLGKNILTVIVLLLLLYSCSTTNVYQNHKFEFGKSVTSSDGNYTLHVPGNWFAADSSEIAPLLFLLASANGSASISFIKINVAPDVKKLNLKNLLNYEKKLFLLAHKNYKTSGRESSLYGCKQNCLVKSFKSETGFVRLAVFKYNNNYFKSVLRCTAKSLKNSYLQNVLIEKFSVRYVGK